tara:strand:- start:299 stop:832 length:534 start_codon:yes stop_codon:yes gene_type:complete
VWNDFEGVVRMAEETRYWKRIGMRVTKKMALQFAEKMNLAATFLDEDIEEFTAVSSTEDMALDEIEKLFESPDEYTDGDPEDASVKLIRQAQVWHKERKPRLMELRGIIEEEFLAARTEDVAAMVAEGMSEDDANKEWDEKLKSRTLEEAKIRWDEEYTARVESLQEELGLASPNED